MFDHPETYPTLTLFRNIDNSDAVCGLCQNPSQKPQTMEDEEGRTMQTHQGATPSVMTSLLGDNHLCQIKSPVQG